MEINPNVTRIDIDKQDTGCLVLTWEGDWIPGERPATVDKYPDDFDEVVRMLRSKGWDVIYWKFGARAWWGKRRPVRSTGQIRKKRADVQRSANWYQQKGLNNLSSLNLAFYL